MSPLDRQSFSPRSFNPPPHPEPMPPHHEPERSPYAEHRSYVPQSPLPDQHVLHAPVLPPKPEMEQPPLVGPSGVTQRRLRTGIRQEAQGWTKKVARKFGLDLGGSWHEEENIKKFSEEAVKSLPKSYGGIIRPGRLKRELYLAKKQQLHDFEAGKSKEYYGWFRRMNLLRHLLGSDKKKN